MHRRTGTTQRTTRVESLENRLLLATQVLAGQPFLTEDGVAAIRMSWKGQTVSALRGQWIVQLDGYRGYLPDQVNLAGTKVTAAGSAFRVNTHLGANGLFSVYAPLSLTVDQVMQRFGKIPGFRYAEPDMLYQIQATPNDPSFSTMWGLNNTGQSGGTVDADIDAPEAWDVSTGSSSVVVGMVDSGIDLDHPDLAANLWVNPYEIPGNGIDDEGNGYVDDINGWDWWGDAASDGVGDSNPDDQNDHGTHTAGTVGARGNNAVGVTGINWNVKMMALKIGGAGTSVSGSDAVSAMNYILDMKARGQNVRVSNHSWGGGGFSSTMNTVIANHANAGLLVVAAAGNNGTNNDTSAFYPANYNQPNLISVGNLTRSNARNSGSNYGQTTVDLFAPGTTILSTVRGGGYASLTGTSMAAPHVTGVAALAFAVAPGASYSQVRDAILTGVESVSSLATLCVTGGRLSADDALSNLPNVPAIPGTPDLSAADDAGISNSDNITNVTTPTFSGSGTNGQTVKILADGVEVGSGVVSGGTYTVTTTALSHGVRNITAVQTDGVNTSSPSSTLAVNIDTVVPSITNGGNPLFGYFIAAHSLTYGFSENVSGSLVAADLDLLRLPATSTPASVSYNGGTNTATFTFPSFASGTLPDGRYRATIPAANVTDVAGNGLAADAVFDFVFMLGDANNDGTVDLSDFNLLAINFGQSPRNFGHGDFNYNGIVNLDDFNILASRFGTSLAPDTFASGESIGGDSLVDDLLA